ncbi:hypothetical protein C8R44DRAFT_896096 [Mycena epipterygia]|nr:hypothetical protein C8R44DRAFT_896096 [Mycena epipterygia]
MPAGQIQIQIQSVARFANPPVYRGYTFKAAVLLRYRCSHPISIFGSSCGINYTPPLASHVSLTGGSFIDAAHSATPGRGREFGCELRVDGLESMDVGAAAALTSTLARARCFLHLRVQHPFALPRALCPSSIHASASLLSAAHPGALLLVRCPDRCAIRLLTPYGRPASLVLAAVPHSATLTAVFSAHCVYFCVPSASPVQAQLRRWSSVSVLRIAPSYRHPAPLVIRPLLIVSSNSSLHAFSPSALVGTRFAKGLTWVWSPIPRGTPYSLSAGGSPSTRVRNLARLHSGSLPYVATNPERLHFGSRRYMYNSAIAGVCMRDIGEDCAHRSASSLRSQRRVGKAARQRKTSAYWAPILRLHRLRASLLLRFPYCIQGHEGSPRRYTGGPEGARCSSSLLEYPVVMARISSCPVFLLQVLSAFTLRPESPSGKLAVLSLDPELQSPESSTPVSNHIGSDLHSVSLSFVVALSRFCLLDARCNSALPPLLLVRAWTLLSPSF